MINIDSGWLVGIGGVIVAFLALKSRSSISSKLKDQERRTDAINNANEVRNEINKLSDADILARATKWVRNNKR